MTLDLMVTSVLVNEVSGHRQTEQSLLAQAMDVEVDLSLTTGPGLPTCPDSPCFP